MQKYQTVIIGAGQAGVALSHCLQQRGVSHIVLESDRPFSDWYRRRWDSFAMNTPNWMNSLPGATQQFAPTASRNAYGTYRDALDYFEAYLSAVQPPIRIEQVSGIDVNRDGSWHVVTGDDHYNADNVAVCTGHAGLAKIPPVAAKVPAHVRQLHSSQYQRPEQIQTANVLVVGSGSSGVQICQDLAVSSRFQSVALCESGNLTMPWSILGVPTYTLMKWLGVFKITRESWIGRWTFPKLETKGDPATPPSPRSLAKKYGVRRFGRIRSADDDTIQCGRGQQISTTDLTIVWCTGFTTSYDFMDPDVRDLALDQRGIVVHHRGVVASLPGLYFLGLRFQHTLVSQDLFGVGQDAPYIADHIAARLRSIGSLDPGCDPQNHRVIDQSNRQ